LIGPVAIAIAIAIVIGDRWSVLVMVGRVALCGATRNSFSSCMYHFGGSGIVRHTAAEKET